MILSDLELYVVEMPSQGDEPPLRSLVVRLAAENGLEGWGESRAEWRPGELAARRDALLPNLAGRSAFDIEDLLAQPVLRAPAVRLAIEMASWDLVGRIAGQPICHLFGGGYRRGVPLSVRIEGRTPAKTAGLAREMAEQGFHCQTIAASGDLACDLEMFAAVRQMVPDRTEIRFDLAASYDFTAAWDLCSRIEGQPLQFLLDPLRSPDLDQVASLRRQTNVPLAVGRALRGPSDVLALVRSGAAPAAVIDLTLVGGLVPARKCASVLQAAGLSGALAVGGTLGIAAAAMVQLAAATPAYTLSCECGYHPLRDDLLVEPLALVDGMLAVPHGPGLGIEVDRGKLDRHQVDW